MKKLMILTVVLVLTLVSVMPAVSKGGTVNLQGTIESIDPDALTFTINVGYPLHYEGNLITVQVTDATRLKECVDGTASRILFSDLKTGLDVNATGIFDGGVLIAVKVIVYP